VRPRCQRDGAVVKLVFFGHDARDAAVQRRIKAFAGAGADVAAFTMRRGAPIEADWTNIDLGETRDAAFGQRIGALAAAGPVLRQHRETLRGADIIYARNLDMLALARWAQGMSGSRPRLVYECLDVHRFLSREDPIGAGLRTVEGALLRDVALVVVSSPAFVREYFDKRYPGRVRALLVENRLPNSLEYGPRPAEQPSTSTKLRIGWFGNLRCERSLSLLLDLAARFPDRVELTLRGEPARAAVGDFEARVSGRGNVRFGGRYAWPRDLADIYRDVDLVWAGDFHDAGANSKWLLPNRLYEGGYYGAPPLAPADCETGRWIEAHGFGFTLAEPLDNTLPAFVRSLGTEELRQARQRLLAAPASVFVQPENELQSVIDAALASPGR
jgi:succinoglycan biosynthesis protein ExoL